MSTKSYRPILYKPCAIFNGSEHPCIKTSLILSCFISPYCLCTKTLEIEKKRFLYTNILVGSVACDLYRSLLHICCWACQQKNFESRSVFDKVMELGGCTFLDHPVCACVFL